MIYLFSGDDAKNKQETCEKFIKSLPKDMEVFFILKNDFDPMEIESFYSGASLFFKRSALVFSNIFENEERKEFILEKLNLMGDSENYFIFQEGKLDKATLDTFKTSRAELNIFELSKEKKEKFNNFLLADAFGNKDRLNLWIYFRQAIDKGVGMEELVGVLFWKAKDMILKRNFYKFSEDELSAFASRLSYLLPEARKNGIDDEARFERFLLEAF